MGPERGVKGYVTERSQSNIKKCYKGQPVLYIYRQKSSKIGLGYVIVERSQQHACFVGKLCCRLTDSLPRPSVQHRQEIGGDICLTTLEQKETFDL